METSSVWLDKDDGRAEVVLTSPDGTFFSIARAKSGTWSDASKEVPFTADDIAENFSVMDDKEAAILSQEALAAVPSPKPIRNKAASSAKARRQGRK